MIRLVDAYAAMASGGGFRSGVTSMDKDAAAEDSLGMSADRLLNALRIVNPTSAALVDTPVPRKRPRIGLAKIRRVTGTSHSGRAHDFWRGFERARARPPRTSAIDPTIRAT
jgi:hypothetical protein